MAKFVEQDFMSKSKLRLCDPIILAVLASILNIRYLAVTIVFAQALGPAVSSATNECACLVNSYCLLLRKIIVIAAVSTAPDAKLDKASPIVG